MSKSFSSQMQAAEEVRDMHAHGGFHYRVLEAIEQAMPENMHYTAETGCGRSTILFSNLSKHHTVFCLDDRDMGAQSSIAYFENSTLTKPKNINLVLGPTQETLMGYQHANMYDCVLIDGPHGYPFPDLEYFHFYPHIRPGGLLIVDDVHIASIGRMADILQEDAMWHLEQVVKTTAIFRRTDVETFSPVCDGWWQQAYNQRRTYRRQPFYLNDGFLPQSFYDRYFSHVKKPGKLGKKSRLGRIKKFLTGR